VNEHRELTVRQATEADLAAVGRLGAELLRTHYAFDSERFMRPGADAEEGYAWFLGTQLGRDDAVVLIAERDGVVVGYLYASIEPASWKELRERAGFIHDLLVAESSRRTGVASALMAAGMEWLRAHGAPRVVLWTAARNAEAQQLFDRLGFRKTMIEMTRELE
jgi:ribosomal protein S18 acetylase RimI-like enzyme